MVDISDALLFECTCSAIFRNRDNLLDHLAQIETQKSYHSTQLDWCLEHKERHTQSQFCDGSCDYSYFICPYETCKKGSNPLNTKQNLERHYGDHVRCSEVCVYCHKEFKTAHKFVRHVEDIHKKEMKVQDRKWRFISETLQEMSVLVRHELHFAKHEKSLKGKRPLETDSTLGSTDAERIAKVHVTNKIAEGAGLSSSMHPRVPSREAIGNVEGFAAGNIQSINIDRAVDMSTLDMHQTVDGHQMHAPVNLNLEETMGMNRMDMNAFGNVPTQFMYSNQVEGADTVYAPILTLVSSPATWCAHAQ